MERNPNERYQSAADFAADLNRFCQRQAIVTRRTSVWRHWREWLMERPKLVVSAAVISMLIIGLLLISVRALSGELRVSEAHRNQLASHLALVRDKDPGQALALAIESSRLVPSIEAEQAMLAALDELHEVRKIDIGDALPGKLVFSPDGALLVKCIDNSAFSSKDGRAVVYDATTGQELNTLVSGTPITDAAFSPSGRLLVTSGTSFPMPVSTPNSDPNIIEYAFAAPTVWDTKNLRAPTQVLTSVKTLRIGSDNFSRWQPRAVFPAATDNEAIVFNTDDWKREEFRLRGGHSSAVLQSIFSPDGKWILTWSQDKNVVLWKPVMQLLSKNSRWKPHCPNMQRSASHQTQRCSASSRTKAPTCFQ